MPIKDFEHLYLLSSFGKVKSLSTGRIRKFSESTPYQQVTLFNKVPTFLWVHRLVAQHFVPNPSNKPVVNHIDGNKKNNCADNLEWCTMGENNAHAGRMKLKPHGTKHHMSKFTQVDIEVIKNLRSSGMLIRSIAKKFGVSLSVISNILAGKSYAK